MFKVKFVDNSKTYEFNHVSKLHLDFNETIIGYTDEYGVYHEESGDSPDEIFLEKEKDLEDNNT